MKQRMFLLLFFVVIISFFSFGQEKEINSNDDLAFVFVNFGEIDSACNFLLTDIYFESADNAVVCFKDNINNLSDPRYLEINNFTIVYLNKELRGIKC